MNAVSQFLSATVRRLRGQGDALSRVYVRHPCCAAASMLLVERDYAVDGLILEISRGGILFREASRFTLDRLGAEVRLRGAEESWSGAIVNVRPEGYGIRFEKLLAQDELDAFLDAYAVRYAA